MYYSWLGPRLMSTTTHTNTHPPNAMVWLLSYHLLIVLMMTRKYFSIHTRQGVTMCTLNVSHGRPHQCKIQTPTPSHPPPSQLLRGSTKPCSICVHAEQEDEDKGNTISCSYALTDDSLPIQKKIFQSISDESFQKVLSMM